MSQQDYRTGFDNQTTEKIYGRRKGCTGRGCIIFPIIILIIAGIIAAGYFFLYPMLTPNSIKGELLDLTIVPGKEASNVYIPLSPPVVKISAGILIDSTPFSLVSPDPRIFFIPPWRDV